MILRSPTENENADLRHAAGIQVSQDAPETSMSIWIPALDAGMTQPHFHALYAGHEALIDLRDFRVLRGSLPGRAMTLVFVMGRGTPR